MKILLFGKNGQLGWELQRSLAPLGELIALDRHSQDLCGDLGNLTGIADTVRALRPDVIVNAAAHTAVDKAESEPELARTINAQAPGVLAQEANKLGAWLVHYSTDYVFDGSGSRPWVETDTPAPLGVYGRTKREGEQLVVEHCRQHLMFRTSWVYAARGGNFAKTMLRLAQERERLTVIDDQFGSPTGAELIADVTAHAIRQVLLRPQDAGIYHLAAQGETTWNRYAKHVIAQAQRAQKAMKIIAAEVAVVPTSAFPTPAQRPLNSRLDCTRLQTVFGLTLPTWQQGVDRMLAEIL
ncbi:MULTISPECIES: dTDP-4-dehydrorhamnose reductase [unclassified Polaromonas]|uniref:dTDP-4-dehydrorhamnose reductase n=1 Tax=unclassified Polaromonas TaxID=2638319 RepID=UPI0018CA6758|nr:MULTISPECIES: dTDP-4-dehydrorhamnose reductase [unclassified Polaromonas]MBG6070803.1 dTDP-4-dehydrorhamnose reductase [Polaromonas sp. CG_9.7]MBG6112887.1 dTDP-4-dehydrorhamnose reductase [Polaromonas sp. CG_9.2]